MVDVISSTAPSVYLPPFSSSVGNETKSPATNDKFIAATVDAKEESSITKDFSSTIFEYGREFLESTKSIGPIINLPLGLALGLRVEGSLHTKESKLVKNNPFRNAAHCILEKENRMRKVVWTQTGGVLELGTGLRGTLPPLPFVGVQVGFNPSALLRYKCIKPHLLNFLQNENTPLKESTAIFPFTSQKATNMAAGSEFEVSGSGRLRVLGSLVANLGTPVNSILNAGIGASAFVDYADSREISLNILSLDGDKRVRVTVRQLSEEMAQIGAKAYAGITANIGSALPVIGQGLLSYPSLLLNGIVADKINGFYTCFCVQASNTNKDSGTVITTYDFDLSNPLACDAYNDLMRLSTEAAETLSRKKDSGVRTLKSTDNGHEDKDEFYINLFGDMLCLYQALQNENEGQFTSPDGKTTLFHKTQYKKHESGWFEPTRDVTWQSVSLQSESDQEPRTFYRFRFEKTGEMDTLDYDDYFGLAKSLFLEGKETSPHSHPFGTLDDTCKRILCAGKEVKQLTDIYFTTKGIKNIKESGFKKAKEAFLSTISGLRPGYDLTFLDKSSNLRAILLPIIKTYAAESNAGWLLNFGHSKRLSELETSYRQLCNRSLRSDALTYSNARIFAQCVTQLKDVRSSEDLENFFVSIGKSNGFRYKCWIGALATLAGDDESLVHKHEMSGNGISFRYNDEGKLEEPSEIVAGLLATHL